jgi:hypothetical protein
MVCAAPRLEAPSMHKLTKQIIREGGGIWTITGAVALELDEAGYDVRELRNEANKDERRCQISLNAERTDALIDLLDSDD